MRALARDRPLFHSEADFQHAFAWRIHETMPACGVRLEYKPPGKRIYLDLWLDRCGVAIELKYCTRLLEMEHNGEAFELRNQSANDISRYDFVKDIQRLKSLSENHRPNPTGCYAALQLRRETIALTGVALRSGNGGVFLTLNSSISSLRTLAIRPWRRP